MLPKVKAPVGKIKIENTSGEEGGFGNSDTPGQGEGGGLKIPDFGGRPL